MSCYANFSSWAPLLSSALFISALCCFSSPATAREGNYYGILAMAFALFSTLHTTFMTTGHAAAMICGACVGLITALTVRLTRLPELIALLHSVVGIAAYVIAINRYVSLSIGCPLSLLETLELFFGLMISVITVVASWVAFAKLCGLIPSTLRAYPGKDAINTTFLALLLWRLSIFVFKSPAHEGIVGMTIFAAALGGHWALSIGGADMPVVLSILNAYSGWAAAITGFMLHNTILITIGALVGASGTILAYTMCKSMNRRFSQVLLGHSGSHPLGEPTEQTAPHHAITVEGVAHLLMNASAVAIVPGYGMAVSHAQHAVYQLMQLLDDRNVEVIFGVHPNAGRLPGHLNVLLAEGQIPYQRVLDLEPINHKFSSMGVVLVIGANDTVNPSAQEDVQSPLFGMPVLEVWKARHVVVFKRSLCPGYAGVDNSLFYKKNVSLCLGDARVNVEDIIKALA